MPEQLRAIRVVGGELSIEAAAGEGKSPTFRMLAYNGGPLKVKKFTLPVIVDLEGMDVGRKARPILRDHDQRRVLGHTERIAVEAGRLVVEGVVSGQNEHAREVIEAARQGFEWEASIGADFPPNVLEHVKAGQTARVNGRQVRGPVLIARRSQLVELTVCAVGADRDETEVRIAAQRQEPTMPPEATETTETTTEQTTETDLQAMRQRLDAQEAELKKLREDRTKTPPTRTVTEPKKDEPNRALVLEAAFCSSLGVDQKRLEASFDEPTLQASRKLRGIGLRGLAAEVADAAGYAGPRWGCDDDQIRAAMHGARLEAASGPTTISLPNILANTFEKVALMTYEAAQIQAFKIARTASARDFKQVSRVRLVGTGLWEVVNEGGELAHGKLDEQAYTNQADTYGQIITVGRKTIKNDDAQTLADLAKLMGQQGAEFVNHLTFTLLLANTGNFFHADNSNYISGATTLLSSPGLTAGYTSFLKQTAGPGTKAKDQRPINIEPRILLVPPEQAITARSILKSATLETASASGGPTYNPWQGEFELVVAPHLSNSSYTGYSTTAWYLFADPARLPALELLFVDGVQSPRIEQVDLPADQLGRGFRGYLDVGVNFLDPKGALKSKGAA